MDFIKNNFKNSLLFLSLFLFSFPLISSAAFFQIWETKYDTSGSEYSVGSAVMGNFLYSAVNRPGSNDSSKIKIINKNTGEFIREIEIPSSDIVEISADQKFLFVTFAPVLRSRIGVPTGDKESIFKIFDSNLNLLQTEWLNTRSDPRMLHISNALYRIFVNRNDNDSRTLSSNKAVLQLVNSPGVDGGSWLVLTYDDLNNFGLAESSEVGKFVFYGNRTSNGNFLEVRNINDGSVSKTIDLSYYSYLGVLNRAVSQGDSFYLQFDSGKLIKISPQEMYKIDGRQNTQFVGGRWAYDYIEPPESCPAEFDNAGWTSSNKTNGVTAGYCFNPVYDFSKRNFVRTTSPENCLTALGCFLKPQQSNPLTVKVTSTLDFGSSTLVYIQPSSYKDYYYDKGFGSDGILDLSGELSLVNSLSISGETLTLAGVKMTFKGGKFSLNPKIVRVQRVTGFITSIVNYDFSGGINNIFSSDENTHFASGWENGPGYLPLAFKLGALTANDTIRSSHIVQFRNFIEKEQKGSWVDPVGIDGKDRHGEPVNKFIPPKWTDLNPLIIKRSHFEELKEEFIKIFYDSPVNTLSFSQNKPISASFTNSLMNESKYVPTWHNQPNLNLSLCNNKKVTCPDSMFGKQWRTDRVIRGVRVSGSSDDNGFCHVFWHADSVSVANFRSGSLPSCEHANGNRNGNRNPHLEADQYGVVGYCLNSEGGDGSMGSNSKLAYIPPGMNIYIRSMYSSNDSVWGVTCNVDLLY